MSLSESPQQLIDKDTLNEAERQLVEVFERRSESSKDDGALTSAEDLSDTTGTPGSTDTSTAAPEPTPPVEGQAVGSESEPSTTTEPEPEPQPEPQPTPLGADGQPITGEGGAPVEEPAQSSSAFTFAGVNYGPDELTQAVQVRDWYLSLNQPQIQAIDALLSGTYRLVPANEADAAQQSASPPVTPPASSSSSQPVGDEAGEWLDPRAEAEINRLRTELTQIRTEFQSAVTPVVQSQQDQALQQRVSAIDAAHVAFRDDYSLNDDQMQQLGQAVVQANIFPALIARHNGDVEAATRSALDMMFWSTPQFRDLKTQQDLTALATESTATIDKQKKMSALASSGGSVPRTNPTPRTKDERYAAMVEAIRQDQNGSGSI